MNITVDMIRRTGEGVCITKGMNEVILKNRDGEIQAHYKSGPLVNGSAIAFAEKVRLAALKSVSEAKLPWHIDWNGSIRITDQKRYYEQTFDDSNLAVETLYKWMHRGRRLAELR